MTPLAATIAAIVAMVGVPAVFVAVAARRGGRLRTLGLGAAMYACAFPLLLLAIGVGSAALEPLGGAVLLSVVAGVTEEVSRWLWFRRARGQGRANRPIDGVMAGLGHGGLEALWFALPMALLALGLATDNLMQGYTVPPAIELLLPGLLRPVFVLGHVGFSLAVWTGANTGDRRWLWGAIAVHIAADLVGFGGPLLLPAASHAISVGLVVAVFVGLAWVSSRAARV